MAWSEKLPSGRYRGVYRDAAGRKHSVDETFTHKAAAKRAAGEAEQRARRNLWRDPKAGRRTWGAWCEDWWKSRTVEGATLKTDAGRRDKHLIPKWGAVPIGAITRHEVKLWRAEMRDAGMTNSTINRAVALLSVSLSAAVEEGSLDHNPLIRLEKLTEPPAKRQKINEEQAGRLLAQLPSKRDQLIVKTLASTGLRWGELAGLHRARVDFDRGLILVVEAFSERIGEMKAYPKGKSDRVVPVPDWLIEELAEVPYEGTTCGVHHSSGSCIGPLLLTTAGGSVLRNTNWSPIFRQAVEDSGVGPLRIHDLRGTAASWWLTGGNELAEVRKFMGHRDSKTTDRYAEISGVNVARATGAIPRLG